MQSPWVLAVAIAITVGFSIFVRRMTARFDAVLLVVSGATSLVLAAFAASAVRMSREGGMMGFEMSKMDFNVGVLSPVFIVATLTVMRGVFKFIQG